MTLKTKYSYSWIAVLLISVVLLAYRISPPGKSAQEPLKVTTWDAFGYYMYLPAVLIYQDMTQLEWLPKIDATYGLTGGEVYQANRFENGNFVFKYLGGVALLQLPFFALGHTVAILSDYPADGFSAPYQFAIAFGAVFYVILALFLLRRILLRYFTDFVTGTSLLLMGLATNLIQYVSIDSAQSHAYIFPLYVLVIYFTIRWHDTPQRKWAFLIGLLIGIATISRPTEAIMIFIPLLWNTHTREAKKAKWAQVRQHRSHWGVAILGGILGILPQLIYWKLSSGQWVYDVGSKWFFLNPWFRVLFGFENGWFIYTPVTLFFVLGFFFMKRYSFQKSVLLFCLLNIWIVIAWSDWKYGATYSTRALVQSYPVFILAFASILDRLLQSKARVLVALVGVYLVAVNLFQIGQYNEGVLHYRDMNRHYYARIYLNPTPEPIDMSLLDSDEYLHSPQSMDSRLLLDANETKVVKNEGHFPDIPARTTLTGKYDNLWIRVDMEVEALTGFATSYLHCKIVKGENSKEKIFRLANPISRPDRVNDYAFYVHVPKELQGGEVVLFFTSFTHFTGSVHAARVEQFSE